MPTAFRKFLPYRKGKIWRAVFAADLVAFGLQRIAARLDRDLGHFACVELQRARLCIRLLAAIFATSPARHAVA